MRIIVPYERGCATGIFFFCHTRERKLTAGVGCRYQSLKFKCASKGRTLKDLSTHTPICVCSRFDGNKLSKSLCRKS